MECDQPTYGDDALSRQIDEQLAALERADSWRVQQVLKASAFETTELVFFEGRRGGELGAFVRKHIDCAAGVGSVYESLWQAQQSGIYLKHVPRLIECTRTGMQLRVVMEHVSGVTLEHLVKQDGGGLDLVSTLMPCLCDAVLEIHERLGAPVIHRDLKPSNIIVRDGDPVIIDFGIARTWRTGATTDTTHFGTRPYAPPEQFGFGQTDVRSDVYALGMILYYCLTERTPSPSAGKEARSDPAIPSALAEVIVRATAFDPASRYPSARSLKEAFLQATGETDAETPPTAAFESTATQSGTEPATHDTSESARAEEEQRPSPSAAPAIASEASRFPKHSETSKSALSHAVTIVRNVLAVGLWALFFAAATSLVFDPNDSDAALPLAVRVMRYYGCVLSLFTACAYFILDRRTIGRRIPLLKARSWRTNLAIGATAIIVCFVMAALATAVSN